MLHYQRKICTSDSQDEITTGAYEYILLVVPGTSFAFSILRVQSKAKEMLMTFVFKRFRNWTALNVKEPQKVMTNTVGEATTLTKTNTTKEHPTHGMCPSEEGERAIVGKSVLLNRCGKFSTSNMEKELALNTAIERGRNYEFRTPFTKLIILDLVIAED
jgi:hypothetical protein